MFRKGLWKDGGNDTFVWGLKDSTFKLYSTWQWLWLPPQDSDKWFSLPRITQQVIARVRQEFTIGNETKPWYEFAALEWDGSWASKGQCVRLPGGLNRCERGQFHIYGVVNLMWSWPKMTGHASTTCYSEPLESSQRESWTSLLFHLTLGLDRSHAQLPFSIWLVGKALPTRALNQTQEKFRGEYAMTNLRHWRMFILIVLFPSIFT